MDPTVKQSVVNAVTSTVAAAVSAIQTKHKEKMPALQEIIEKFLFFRDSSFFTSPPNLNTFSKAFFLVDF